MSWGPFMPDLAAGERKARLRALRALVKVMLGPRGRDAAVALLSAEIAGDDPETLTAAATEFDHLAPLDRRRVLSAFQSVT